MNLKRIALDAGVRTEVTPLGCIGEGKAYKVDTDTPATVIIIDTENGLRIACEPELVGRELETQALKAAETAAALIAKAARCRRAVFLHILRASMGYRLHDALKLGGFQLVEAFLRVRYPGTLIGSHEERRAQVVYSSISRFSEEVLIVADTVATGETLEKALEHFIREAEGKGTRIKEVHVYGFLSEAGVGRVAVALDRLGVEKTFFYAIQDLAALASNNYDMLLYGPDLSGFRKGKTALIGGIAAEDTLERMLSNYFPGMDQPGDWSERQCFLFNGSGYEKGRIPEHLERSLHALEELRQVMHFYSWYNRQLEEVYAKRRDALLQAIIKGDYCAQPLHSGTVHITDIR